jgi:subtilisin-like proprotein convertase family protein
VPSAKASASVAVVALLAASVTTATVSPATASSGTYSQPGAVSIGQASTVAGGAAVTINDATTATPYPSTATVAGLVGAVTDVNLTLFGFSHTFPDDVDVVLASPSGKRAVVLSDAGGETAVTAIDLTMDDQAAQSLPDSLPLAAGSYRPADHEVGDTFAAPAPDTSGAGAALSVFNDSNANGTWQLFVVDDDAEDTGSLTGWRLDIATTGPLPYPSALTVAGAHNSITDVNVVLNGFTHTSPSDVDVLLVGPGGQQATVLSDVGSDADASGVNLVLDDDAATQVPTPVVAGTFQPTNSGASDPFPAPAPTASGSSSLEVFNGSDPNGTWRLFVTDDAAGDIGALAGGWALQIHAADTIAPRVAQISPAAGKKSVKRSANVKATFSEDMRRTSLNKKTVYLVRQGTQARVPAALRYRADKFLLTLNPKGLLSAGTRYRVVITTKVKDVAGNRLDQNGVTGGLQQRSWTFKTR